MRTAKRWEQFVLGLVVGAASAHAIGKSDVHTVDRGHPR